MKFRATISKKSSNSFNSLSDPIADTIGPAWKSHPEEYDNIIAFLKQNEVERVYRKGQYGYSPSVSKGKPGRIIIDEDASISAWRHELGHFKDDKAMGFPGFTALKESKKLNWAFERKQYLEEIKFAKSIGDERARKVLIQNAYKEKRHIYGR